MLFIPLRRAERAILPALIALPRRNPTPQSAPHSLRQPFEAGRPTFPKTAQSCRDLLSCRRGPGYRRDRPACRTSRKPTWTTGTIALGRPVHIAGSEGKGVALPLVLRREGFLADRAGR